MELLFSEDRQCGPVQLRSALTLNASNHVRNANCVRGQEVQINCVRVVASCLEFFILFFFTTIPTPYNCGAYRLQSGATERRGNLGKGTEGAVEL